MYYYWPHFYRRPESNDRFHLNDILRREDRLMKRNVVFIKVIAAILAVILFVPVNARAAVPETATPMASDYLAAYTAYICAMGNGELQIWFRVTGTGTQEYIGVLMIRLYESTDNENWYWVNTFLHEDYGTMLAQNTFAHMNYVPYQAVPGRYYKAYVTIWGGPDDCGDTRYIWTPVELCT